jgi:hypothetical protein
VGLRSTLSFFSSSRVAPFSFSSTAGGHGHATVKPAGSGPGTLGLRTRKSRRASIGLKDIVPSTPVRPGVTWRDRAHTHGGERTDTGIDALRTTTLAGDRVGLQTTRVSVEDRVAPGGAKGGGGSGSLKVASVATGVTGSGSLKVASASPIGDGKRGTVSFDDIKTFRFAQTGALEATRTSLGEGGLTLSGTRKFSPKSVRLPPLDRGKGAEGGGSVRRAPLMQTKTMSLDETRTVRIASDGEEDERELHEEEEEEDEDEEDEDEEDEDDDES